MTELRKRGSYSGQYTGFRIYRYGYEMVKMKSSSI
jgi:hypothetical protein